MRILIIVSVLALAHVCRTYVLLTANIEDLQAIAQRIVDSPMAGHVTNIVRRATNAFNQQINKNKHDYDDGDIGNNRHYRSEDKIQSGENLSSMINTKNASIFLKSIKKIFENI